MGQEMYAEMLQTLWNYEKKVKKTCKFTECTRYSDYEKVLKTFSLMVPPNYRSVKGRVLGFFDISTFGNLSKGFLITTEAIYWKLGLFESGEVTYSDLNSVFYDPFESEMYFSISSRSERVSFKYGVLDYEQLAELIQELKHIWFIKS